MEQHVTTVKQQKDRLIYLKQKAVTEDLYLEAQDIRDKFLETRLYEVDTWTWKIIHEYMHCKEAGWTWPGQEGKMREAVIKYGSESPFWSELERTRRQRREHLARLSYAMRLTNEALDKGGLTRKIRKELHFFRKVAVDLRRKLRIMEFSPKQMKILFKIERILGIYYDDLSEEENGLSYRKELEKEENE